MSLRREQGRTTDSRYRNANDNKQTLIRKKVAFLPEHDKVVMSLQTGNVFH